jgi:hypothetical protein
MAVSSQDPVNWKITQGETFSLQLEYQDPQKQPINISDYTVTFIAKNKPQGKIVSATCSIGDGINMDQSNQGIVNVSVSGQKTALFNYPRTYYKIEATTPSSEDFVLLQGWFEVTAG